MYTYTCRDKYIHLHVRRVFELRTGIKYFDRQYRHFCYVYILLPPVDFFAVNMNYYPITCKCIHVEVSIYTYICEYVSYTCVMLHLYCSKHAYFNCTRASISIIHVRVFQLYTYEYFNHTRTSISGTHINICIMYAYFRYTYIATYALYVLLLFICTICCNVCMLQCMYT